MPFLGLNLGNLAKKIGDTIGLDGHIGYQGTWNQPSAPRPPAPTPQQRNVINNVGQATGFRPVVQAQPRPAAPRVAPTFRIAPPTPPPTAPHQLSTPDQIVNTFHNLANNGVPGLREATSVVDKLAGVDFNPTPWHPGATKINIKDLGRQGPEVLNQTVVPMVQPLINIAQDEYEGARQGYREGGVWGAVKGYEKAALPSELTNSGQAASGVVSATNTAIAQARDFLYGAKGPHYVDPGVTVNIPRWLAGPTGETSARFGEEPLSNLRAQAEEQGKGLTAAQEMVNLLAVPAAVAGAKGGPLNADVAPALRGGVRVVNKAASKVVEAGDAVVNKAADLTSRIPDIHLPGLPEERGSIALFGTPEFARRQAAGETPERLVTGEPFYKYSDQNMSVKETLFNAAKSESPRNLTVGDIITHNDMAAANPELMGKKVVIKDLGPTTTGRYTSQGVLILNRSMIVAAMRDTAALNELKRTIVHELTHAEEYRAGSKGVSVVHQHEPSAGPVEYVRSPAEVNARLAETHLNKSNEQLSQEGFYDPHPNMKAVHNQLADDVEKSQQAYAEMGANDFARENLPAPKDEPKKRKRPQTETSKKGAGKGDPMEKVAKVRDTEIKPVRTHRVVRDELKQTKPIKKETAKGLKVTKAYGRKIEKEIKEIIKSNRSDATKRRMVQARVSKMYDAAEEAAVLAHHLEKINEFRRKTGFEAQRAKKRPPLANEDQIKNADSLLDQADTILHGASPEAALQALEQGKKGDGSLTSWMQKLFQDKPNEAASKALSSTNKVRRGGVRVVQSVVGELGKSKDQVTARRALRGALAEATESGQKIFDEHGNLDVTTREKIFNYMNPETLGDRAKVSIDDLTPAEKQIAETLRTLADIYHDVNYQIGRIGESTYEKGKGDYMTRSYHEHEFAPEIQQHFQKNKAKMDDTLVHMRKGLTKEMMDDMLRDPFYAVARQARFTYTNMAVFKYANWVARQEHLVRDMGEGVTGASKDGFVKLSDHPSYGPLAGKWVRRDVMEEMKGFYFDNAILQGMFDIGAAFERSALRRGAKALKTSLNPLQHVVNRAYNYAVATLNGVNPLTFFKHERVARKMIRANDPLVVALKRRGVLGSDIASQELKNKAKQIHVGGKNTKAVRAFNKAADEYGLTDDGAKLALILAWTKRGHSLDNAIERSTRAMQDYTSVGKAWDVSAKVPVFGKAFGRFTGDFIRVAHNTAVDHPLRTVAAVVAYKYAQQLASELSGEDPEDRKTREHRAGAGHLPLLGDSTEFKIGDYAVDIRRFLGPTTIGNFEDDGTSLNAGLDAFNPLNIHHVGGKLPDGRTDLRGLATDPLVGPAMSLLTDQDFTGRSIRKPDQQYNPGKDVSVGEQAKNVFDFSRRSLSPGLNDAEDIIRNATGNPSYYESKKADPETPTGEDAILKAIKGATGVRVTKYGMEDAEKSRSTSSYFTAKDKARNSLVTADERTKFDDYLSRQRDDKGHTIQEGPVEAAKNYSILLGDDNVRNAVQAMNQSQENHDPIWDLDPAKLKTFMAYETMLPSSAERWKISQDNQWLPDIQASRSKFFSDTIKAGSTIPNGPQYPEIAPETQAAMKEYQNVAAADKSAYLSDHPDLLEAWDKISKYSNEVRVARGAPELAPYPKASDRVEDIIKTYNALPKHDGPKGGSKTRAAWIKANQSTYNEMTNYFTQVAIYNLAQEGAKVELKGVPVTQEFLKNAYNLGQYDITKNADGSFSLGGGSDSGSGSGSKHYGYGSGGSKKYSDNNSAYSEPSLGMSSRSGVSMPSGKISVKPVSVKHGKKRRIRKGVPNGPTRLT